MGIFNKKLGAKRYPAYPHCEAPTEEACVCPKVDKPKEVKKTDLGDGLEAISGQLPEGFDPTNRDEVKALIESALKEAGIMPPDGTIESMEMVKVGEGEAEKLVGLLSKSKGGKTAEKGEGKRYGSMKEVMAGFEGMRNDPVPIIPTPQDPAKAAFVNSLNCLHKQVHLLGPIIADLYQAFECLELTMKAGNPTSREKARFKAFELALVGMIAKMSEFGSEVCQVAELTERAGIPVPDSPAVVN